MNTNMLDLSLEGAAPPTCPTARPESAWGALRHQHLQALETFQDQLLQMTGIRFSIRSLDGVPLVATACDPDGPDASASPAPGWPDDEVVNRLIRRMEQTGQTAQTESDTGVLTLVAPVKFRGQLVAASVGSYLATEALDEPIVGVLAERAGLSVEDARQRFRPAALYSRQAAPHVSRTAAAILHLKEGELLKEREICELTENLLNTYEEITFLYKISNSISVASSTTEIMDLIITELLHVLDVECMAAVDLPGPDASRAPNRTLIAGDRLIDAAGLRNLFVMYLEQRLEPGRPYVDNHFQESATLATYYPKVRSLMIVPLVYNRETLSILVAVNKRHAEEFTSGDVKLVSSIASESAVHLKNSQLYEDLRALLYSVIRALSSAIDAKDPYTCGHSERVAFVARSIAERLHLPPAEIESIYLSGLLHDVGKIGISEEILGKHGRLTDKEMEHIRRHPEIGSKILGNLKQLTGILPGVRFHHERIDGKGYPLGLKDEEIPLIGRIIAVADGYDAMTSHRPYRKALPQEVVLNELRSNSGSQFDPTIVGALLQLIEEPHFREIYRNMNTPDTDEEGGDR